MEQQVPEVNAVGEENASQGVEVSLSSPDIGKHAEKLTLEEKGGDVMDKLVKNPSRLGGCLQGCLWCIIPV